MKALVCEQPGALILTERPDPTPSEGEAIIRIRRVGVCGTDFHIFAGKHPYLAYPRIMGHELAGEVAHAPPGSALRPGQTVYIVPYLACGHCRACRRGLTNACRNLSVLGVHQDGGMAEYLAVPEANVVGADGLSLDDAATVEFLAIGAHGVRRGAVTEADRVLVIGAGPIGMSAIVFASPTRRPCHRARHPRRTASTSPAPPLSAPGPPRFCPTRPDPSSSEATDGDFFDVVIDATGNAASIRRGLDFVGHGGRHVLLSVVRDDLVFPDPEFHKRERPPCFASRNALPADFADVVTAIRDGRVPTGSRCAHIARRCADAATSFPAWLRPEAGVIKAILDV